MTDPTINDLQTADLLDQAADYIETHGWHQTAFSSAHGAVCASAAFRAVAPPGSDRQTSAWERACREALVDYLGLVPAPGATGIACHPVTLLSDWNDDPERTADEVVAAMRHTAKHLAGGAR